MGQEPYFITAEMTSNLNQGHRTHRQWHLIRHLSLSISSPQ